jgi:hypothetical protein
MQKRLPRYRLWKHLQNIFKYYVNGWRVGGYL